MAEQQHDRVTPDQIEAKLRGVLENVEHKAQDTKQRLVPVAIGGGLFVLFLAYLLGKRVGKKKSTVVQIRRI